jgi:flavodoxin long chain
MKKIGIFYGSSTGSCEVIAKLIKAEFANTPVDLYDVMRTNPHQMNEYSNLILGLSTWDNGSLQEDWDDFLIHMDEIDFRNKTIALYGLGDQANFPDNFVDGMGILYHQLKDKKCKFVGHWPLDGYDFTKSKAIINNYFVGLAIDEDAQYEKTNERVKKWVMQLRKEFP